MQQFHHEPDAANHAFAPRTSPIVDTNLVILNEAVQAQVDEYLNQVCAPLVRNVPEGVWREWRKEMRVHLESLVAVYVELGETPETAVRHALAQFGAAQAVSRQWKREWKEQFLHAQPQSVKSATLQAMGVLGLTLLVTGFLMLLPPPHSQRLIGVFMTAGAFSGGLLSAAFVRSHALCATRNAVLILSLLLCVLVTPFGGFRTALPLTAAALVFSLTFACLGAYWEQQSGLLRRVSRQLTRLRA